MNHFCNIIISCLPKIRHQSCKFFLTSTRKKTSWHPQHNDSFRPQRPTVSRGWGNRQVRIENMTDEAILVFGNFIFGGTKEQLELGELCFLVFFSIGPIYCLEL